MRQIDKELQKHYQSIQTSKHLEYIRNNKIRKHEIRLQIQTGRIAW